MSVIDARFAGGPILIEQDTLLECDVVKLDLPGGVAVPLLPHEARALAAALTAAAARAESTRKVRRGAAADEYFRVAVDGVVA